MIELTKDYIENLKSIIEAKDDAKAQEVLHELYPADIAELYQELNLQEAIYLYLLMDGDKAADVLMELDEEDRHKLLKELPNELIAKRFVDNMETDDAVDLMRELDEDTQEEILSHIEDVEQAGDIVDLLKYDEDTAGGLMGTEMIVVNENWSMPKCIDEMRKQAEEMSEIYYVYVVDDDERLKGVLPLQKLITHPSVSKIKHVMKKDPISVRDSDSIEEVTETIEKYDLVALPVVDSIGRLVGRITIDDVMDEVREQHERDYQLASGISQDVETSDNVFTQTAARLPWLLIGMIGGLGNSVILGGFESSFATNPKMALFIPLIGGTGGNVGIQSSAIVVQGLAECFISPRYLEYFSLQAPKGEEGMYLGFSHLHSFLSSIFGFGLAGVLLTKYCPDPALFESREAWEAASVNAHYIWYYFAAIGLIAAIALLIFAKITDFIDKKKKANT